MQKGRWKLPRILGIMQPRTKQKNETKSLPSQLVHCSQCTATFSNSSSCEQAGPEVLPEADWVECEIFVPHDHDPWLEEYMARPQTWLRYEVYKFVKNQSIQQPCSAIHVRRTDVNHHSK
jgi:hypothetical protein